MKITLPELSLVVLVGASGCGKSTFARRHFLPTEVISSDYCRGLVADDENDQSRYQEQAGTGPHHAPSGGLPSATDVIVWAKATHIGPPARTVSRYKRVTMRQ